MLKQILLVIMIWLDKLTEEYFKNGKGCYSQEKLCNVDNKY